MIKKLFLGLLLLAVIAVAAIYFFGSSALNKGIKSGVETWGPRVTQTPVTLGAVNLSVFNGSGTLTDLLVGNPEGFASEQIVALGEIDLKVDTSTVFSDKIVIDHVIIQQPRISYEQSLRGSNVKKLMENIEAFTGPKDDTEVDSGEGPGKQVVIRKLIIEDATVYAGAMGIGQTVSIPRIEMENIGEEGDRMTMAEAIELVLGKVLQSIGPSISNAGNLLKDGGKAALDSATEQLDNITEGTRQQLNEAADDAAKKAGDRIQGLFGN
ncbi:MAG: hypothetical protein GVY36_10435 [Verrucomicrobia bacterium]|jgi:hypothetical protein|nr:hypothetical protein [Verrucomicrobiota bacterium]